MKETNSGPIGDINTILIALQIHEQDAERLEADRRQKAAKRPRGSPQRLVSLPVPEIDDRRCVPRVSVSECSLEVFEKTCICHMSEKNANVNVCVCVCVCARKRRTRYA